MFNNQPQRTCKTCGVEFPKNFRECPNCGANATQLIPAKLIPCKACGCLMAENVIKCPHCGKRTKTFFVVAVAIATVVICFSIILVLLLTFDSPTQQTNNNVEQNINAEQQNNILYSDDFFDIEYMQIREDGITNQAYLQLKVTNKSNQKVTLMLDDVYVNDITVLSGTAYPITLESGKISTTPFILFSGNTGLSAEDITKVEFKLTARDDNFNVVHTTSKITITK